MKEVFTLIAILGSFWLINSGHFEILLLGFGTASVAGVILLVRRMQSVDGEYEPPILPTWRLLPYLAWLSGEVARSNFDVVRRVWQKTPDISPTVFTVKAGQAGDLCRALYANSITMTPGTVTLDVRGDELTIHALTREAADGIRSGVMDSRVSSLEA